MPKPITIEAYIKNFSPLVITWLVRLILLVGSGMISKVKTLALDVLWGAIPTL
jgi:hypothetical protein